MTAEPVAINTEYGLPMWLRCDPDFGDRGILDEVIGRDAYAVADERAIRSVLDCGAHIGSFSCWMAERGSAKVVAVEPAQENRAVLERNVERYPAITIDRRAIAAGPVRIEGMSGTSHTVPDAAGTVPTATLPEIIHDHDFDEIHVVKLDMEGAEGPALLACDHDVLLRMRLIVMETHGWPWHPISYVGALVEHLLDTHFIEWVSQTVARHEGKPIYQYGYLRARRYEL